MSNSTPKGGSALPAADSPRVREQTAAHLRSFHKEHVQQLGQSEMLKAYCQAISNWILNPNTNAYQIEMLCDEIYHMARSEDLGEREL